MSSTDDHHALAPCSKTSNVETDTIAKHSRQIRDAYATVCSKFFPSKIWPSFEEYKALIEKWLNSNHANYLKEIGDREWVNAFTENFYAK
ncbi:hypothetical protein C1646_759498 [Rhizophagus diaphanus]|nr:hypothetical protein C1646_759498 [Rhizophagus diaphanus] [Rhizophagus sp. MUCL 43196]